MDVHRGVMPPFLLFVMLRKKASGQTYYSYMLTWFSTVKSCIVLIIASYLTNVVFFTYWLIVLFFCVFNWIIMIFTMYGEFVKRYFLDITYQLLFFLPFNSVNSVLQLFDCDDQFKCWKYIRHFIFSIFILCCLPDFSSDWWMLEPSFAELV